MYAVIRVGHFSLRAILRLEAGLQRSPVALVAREARRSQVLAVNAAAASAGVEVRMDLGRAMGRCKDLAIRTPSPEAEASADAVLFAAAYGLGPRLERTRPGVVTVDLRGAAEHDPTPRLLATSHVLHEQGLPVTQGWAPSPELAFYAALAANPKQPLGIARHEEVAERLDHLDLAQAEFEPPLIEILEGWGVRTCGDFARLPRTGVGERLGTEALCRWDALHGHVHRPLRHSQPEPIFEERFELEYSLQTLEPLLFLVRRALDGLCLRLEVVGRVCQAVRLALLAEQKEVWAKTIQLPEPTRDADTLLRLLQSQLEDVRTEAEVDGLVLRLEPVDPVARQMGLFDTALSDPWRFADTLDRLAGIVGHENVGRPRPRDTHRPDAFVLERLPEEIPPVSEPTGPPPLGPAPHRHRPPLPVRVEVDEHGPIAAEIDGQRLCVIDRCGPWRHSGDWWEAEPWQDEDWDVELASPDDATARRLYRLTCNHRGWHLTVTYD